MSDLKKLSEILPNTQTESLAPLPSTETEHQCKEGLAARERTHDVYFDNDGKQVLKERQEWERYTVFVYCDCPKGSERLKADKDEMVNTYAPIVPTRYKDMTLDSSPCQLEIRQKIRGLTDSFLLWGRHGTGKTGLAVGYSVVWAERRAEQRFKDSEFYQGMEPPRIPEVLFSRFVSTPDLLSELRSTYGRSEGRTENEVLEEYRGIALLILDDIGAEHVKDVGWLEDRLYQIVGYRHAECLDTIFTSNLSPAELGQRIGERLMWRIVEMCGKDGIIEVRGKNLRDRD